MLISYASCRVIDNIAALPKSAGRVASTARANVELAGSQESRRAGLAAAGERFNRRDL
jgi:hypothetical protein